ncbi:hypothetical protein Catovirus_1_71 [Catovirus CTV1]|uniref:Uncharacterized protein n=1 Tax=Catovirus CTV1 TaxID=1977631 RepID=A0A1V0S8J3_9VIRU|nr:hypothetical protein Catovirus_1_71 [Catovirus CTV1]
MTILLVIINMAHNNGKMYNNSILELNKITTS